MNKNRLFCDVNFTIKLRLKENCMTILDFILLIPLIYGAYKGYKTGLVVQVSTFAALFLGIYVAIKFSDVVSNWLVTNHQMQPSSLLPFFAFFLTFVLVAAGVFLLGKVITQMIKPTMLSPVNKFGGLGLGLVKWLYIVGILLVGFETINERKQFASDASLAKSTLYHPILKTTVYTIPALEESSLFLKNQLFNDSSELNTKIKQIRRAKEIADSLGIDSNDKDAMVKLYKDHRLDTLQGKKRTSSEPDRQV